MFKRLVPVAVCVLGAACGGGSPTQPTPPATTPPTAAATPTPAPTPTPVPPPPQVIFSIEPGVSPADESDVRSGFQLATNYFQRTFGWTPIRDITVIVTTAAGASSGTATASTLTINTKAAAWVQRGTTQFHQQTVVHELFHLMQLNLDWAGPVWLTEGTAEFIGWHAALIDQGVYSLADARACQIAGVTVFSSVPVPPLSQLEDNNFYTVNSQRSNTYSAGWMAADELRKNDGIAVFGNFARATGEWRARFQTVFGISVTDFYTHFESVRAGWSRSAPPFRCTL